MNAAEHLEGMTLDGGWNVIEKITRNPKATGGHFSVGYRVQHPSGRNAYLKALDFSAAFERENLAVNLEAMTHAYNFEVSVLRQCGEKRLSRVVKAIDYGETRVICIPSPGNRVCYIIFEYADGDIRPAEGFFQVFDFAFGLRVLHNAAVGLKQLHQSGIAHQDVKPSNVLLFAEEGAKLADLGSASVKGVFSARDEIPIAGDRGYAPLDQWYKSNSGRDMQDRFINDLYLLGNLIFYLFLGVSATHAIKSKLTGLGVQLGDDLDNDLPHIRHAMALSILDLRNSIQAMTSTVSGKFDKEVSEELINIALELCEPDPAKRGDLNARQRGIPRHSLIRYISRFDLLAKKAEFQLK
jgi:serine/threonine protein kinase